jgi:hypothetical protein
VWAKIVGLELIEIHVKHAAVQAGLTLALYAAHLALHVRVKPFVHAYQNKLEAGLSISCLSLVACGTAYYCMVTNQLMREARTLDVVLVMLAFLPLAFYLGRYICFVAPSKAWPGSCVALLRRERCSPHGPRTDQARS